MWNLTKQRSRTEAIIFYVGYVAFAFVSGFALTVVTQPFGALTQFSVNVLYVDVLLSMYLTVLLVRAKQLEPVWYFAAFASLVLSFGMGLLTAMMAPAVLTMVRPHAAA